jgi:PEP-CTERM motif
VLLGSRLPTKIRRTVEIVLERETVGAMKIQTLLAGAAIAVAASLVGASAQAQIVNGGFETGDFTGWIVNGDATGVEGAGFDSENPHSGAFFAALGDTSGEFPFGTLSQTVADTAGQDYVLSYWLMGDGATPNYNDVTWNGATLTGSVVTNLPDTRPDGYTQYQFNVVGTGSDLLLFHEQNEPAYNALDDVALTPGTVGSVPEPATWALMLSGFFGAGAFLRRRRTMTATA